MTRGRKPSANAISRIDVKEALVQVEGESGPMMTASVASIPDAAECWGFIVGDDSRFSEKETPLLEAYCVSYAISRQALRNMTRDDGSVQTFFADENGNVKRNPDIDTYAKSVDQMRKLSGVLGLDTLTDARLNLTHAATGNLAADIPAKVFAAMKAMNDGS